MAVKKEILSLPELFGRALSAFNNIRLYDTQKALSAPSLTPENVDNIIAKYQNLCTAVDALDALHAAAKKEMIEVIKRFGHPSPNAERSHTLGGDLNRITMTTGSTVTIREDKVDEFYELLTENKLGSTFYQIFSERTKHELKADAETTVRTMDLPKRLGQKVMAAFGACISVKDKAPSIKIELLAKVAAKKSAKKGGR